jgi:multiple sugar transport system permease protein
MNAKQLRDNITGYLFIGPQLFGIVVFVMIPLIYAMYLSLYRWDLLSPPRYVGLDNFVNLMNSRVFWSVVRSTLTYSVLYIPLNIVLALAFALLLNNIRGKVFFRTLFFLPVVTNSVAASLIWSWLLHADFGLLNQALKSFGITSPPRWLVSPDTAMLGVVLMSVWWTVGTNMVIFLAGLQSIPDVYYEVASLDGASPRQRFRYVTLPLLTPTIFFVLVITIIGSLQVFDQILVLTNGGPADSTRVIVMYIYSEAFQGFRMGTSAAAALLLFGVLLILTIIQFQLQRRWVHYE